mmetsp:Transcript_18751/g.74852  ORF Transcript_18751/g.74852 Transcript_18751/m.74852 type:complete len:318 (-) Transcript_18751:297-1250(-)
MCTAGWLARPRTVESGPSGLRHVAPHTPSHHGDEPTRPSPFGPSACLIVSADANGSSTNDQRNFSASVSNLVSRTNFLNCSFDTVVASILNPRTRTCCASFAPSFERLDGRWSSPVMPASAPNTSDPSDSLSDAICSPSGSSGAKSVGTSSSAKLVPNDSHPALIAICRLRPFAAAASSVCVVSVAAAAVVVVVVATTGPLLGREGRFRRGGCARRVVVVVGRGSRASPRGPVEDSRRRRWLVCRGGAGQHRETKQTTRDETSRSRKERKRRDGEEVRATRRSAQRRARASKRECGARGDRGGVNATVGSSARLRWS